MGLGLDCIEMSTKFQFDSDCYCTTDGPDDQRRKRQTILGEKKHATTPALHSAPAHIVDIQTGRNRVISLKQI